MATLELPYVGSIPQQPQTTPSPCSTMQRGMLFNQPIKALAGEFACCKEGSAYWVVLQRGRHLRGDTSTAHPRQCHHAWVIPPRYKALLHQLEQLPLGHHGMSHVQPRVLPHQRLVHPQHLPKVPTIQHMITRRRATLSNRKTNDSSHSKPLLTRSKFDEAKACKVGRTSLGDFSVTPPLQHGLFTTV